MFSGIIKATGRIASITAMGSNLRMTIASPLAGELSVDQSVAHDGVCLTVVDVDPAAGTYAVDIVAETLSKTRLGRMEPGDVVNLERAITPQSLLDGHLVQGHVDTVIACLSARDLEGSWAVQFSLPDEYAGLVIPRGSVALNGVSLTVANVHPGAFDVAIIPYTYAHTNFNRLRAGDPVNVEFDMIGKYILRQLSLRDGHA
jgi:riboflavin synthase